jgi:hypothetical protein
MMDKSTDSDSFSLFGRALNERTTLSFLAAVYGVASLVHFFHNATYLRQYPGMPAWLTAAGVWGAWCAFTAIGAGGYWVYRATSERVGLLMLALYAVLGFAGLDHYAVAPVAAHSATMHATILFEAASAAVLLLFVARQLAARLRTEISS